MSPRWTMMLLLIATALACRVAESDDASPLDDSPDASVERMLQAVAVGGEIEERGEELVPQLMRLVEQGNPQESSHAIRALSQLGVDAAPAVDVLCAQLNDAVHATRGFAANALVAIGEPSIEPLREVLVSPSGRVRAAATSALHRLGQLELDDVTALAADPDPRVRATVAQALADFDQSGVATLTQLLSDPEVAVAVEAALALKVNHTDASTAVPVLIESLTRPDLAWAAAEALGGYGIEAQSAIPALLTNLPARERYWEDYRLGYSAEAALSHIGPPRLDDIPVLSECLLHENCEVRILAAHTLQMLGRSGEPAADAVETALNDSLERYQEMQRDAELNPEDRTISPGRWHYAAEELLATLWHVTHDISRFVSALERLSIEAESGLYFYGFSAWDDDFTTEDCLQLESLLRSPNVHVQRSALTAISGLGAIAAPLKEAVLDLAEADNGELSREITSALFAINSAANDSLIADESVPLLLQKVRSGEMTIREFATVIAVTNQTSDEVQAILEYGIEHEDEWTAQACAQAMLQVSAESEAGAAFVIDIARSGRVSDRNIIEILRGTRAAPATVIPYLASQLSNEDFWTRHDAAQALGDYGADAQLLVGNLEELLIDEYDAVRLQAAASIYRITGDPAHFENEVQSVFAADENLHRYEALEMMIDLGPLADPFLPYLMDELHTPKLLQPYEVIDALISIGTPESLAAVEDAAQSTDWIRRSAARTALDTLQSEEARDE